MQRSWWARGAVALVLVTVTAACGGVVERSQGQADEAAPTASASVVPSPSATLAETSLTAAGAKKINVNGDWLVAGEGAVWLSGEEVIYRLDPASGKPVATIPVAQGPCKSTTTAMGWVWTATCSEEGLARIDPRTNRVDKHLPLDVSSDTESSIDAGAGAVWLVADGPDCFACRVAWVQPERMRVLGQVPVTEGAAAVRFGEGSVWVTNPMEDLVEQIDPKSHRVVGRIDVGSGPRFLAVGEGAVWTLNQGDGSVTRIDPQTRGTTSIPTSFAGEGGDITSGGGAVWLRGSDKLLGRVDPKSNRVVEEYGPPAGSGGVIVGFGAVWISAHDISALWRLPLPRS